MTRPHADTRRIAIIVVAAAGVVIPGCQGRRIEPSTSLQTAASVTSDLSVVASIEQPFVVGPDPLAVSYAVRNHGAPRHVRSHPIWFDIVVLSPAGQWVRPLP